MKLIKLAFIGYLGILTLGLTSCGKREVGGSKTPAKAKSVALLSWSEYFAPEVFTEFERRTGIAVDYVTFEDLDELEAILQSQPGRFDVVVTDDSSIDRLRELRLLSELDRSALGNFSNIDSAYLGQEFDKPNAFSVPYLWGTTLIAYRSDRIEDPGDSWALLNRPELKGRVMLLGDRVEALSIGLLSENLEMNSTSPDDIAKAGDSIVRKIKQLDTQFGSDADVRSKLDDGSIWAAVCYSGDAAMVAAENENVSLFIPKEGAPLWMDNFAVVRDSDAFEEAHILINFMLEGEIAAANSNHTWYATPNKAAREFLSEELRADKTVNPPESVRKRCELFDKPDARREELMNSAWAKVQEALRERVSVATSVDGATE